MSYPQDIQAQNATQLLTQVIPSSLVLTDGEQFKTVPLDVFRQWYTPTTQITYQQKYLQEIEKPSLCPVEKMFLCQLILPRTDQSHLRILSQSILDADAIRAYLQQLAPTISTPVIEPKFTLQDGKVTTFASGQSGRVLDITTTLATIQQALIAKTGTEKFSIPLTFTTETPTTKSDDGTNFGIVELLGEGRTNFSGSPKNRIHNFTLAADQFNGLLIPPGKEFSFVEHLGDVDGEHGYLPELVIKKNVTTPEFGGGICQVSTTAFRAALNSGLKISARRNHAYPVSYYKPYGMDATIYIPKPDLQFINNTPAYILIQTAIEGQDLVFRFYGTSDGRKTTIDGPHILERGVDGSMKTTFTQKVVAADGSTLLEDKFPSNYKSPNLFPHPGQEPVFTSKPSDWSQKQWDEYKKTH
ncbi:MAG: VanW family protein [Candidatus Moraniibacteriota bacterium]